MPHAHDAALPARVVLLCRDVWARRLPGRQGRLAFAYLLAERSRPVPRHELANVLWPQRLPAAYDIALSAIVSKLRGLLHELGVGRRALTTASGCYQLQLPADSWVDVEAAKESVHLAESSLRAADPRSAYGHAVVACAVLRRPLLPEAEGGWIETYRYGFRNLRLRALDCLSQIHAWNGEHALALRAGEEAVELEPYRELATGGSCSSTIVRETAPTLCAFTKGSGRCWPRS